MFRFIGRLFRKAPPPPPPGSSPEECWRSDFGSSPGRFVEADEERYALRLADGSLRLELRRGSLFAWADCGDYRYGDASIEAELRFGGPGPKRSAGLLLRKIDDASFLYALVSSDGEARLDLVFNGDPRPLVPWVACPWAAGAEDMVLSVVLRGTRIVVLVNGRFALEAEDDSLDLGGVAFGAQSYDGPATVELRSLRVESRPVEAEADYLRFARVVAAAPDQRRRLAEGLFSLGYYVPALVQLRKIADGPGPAAADRFLEAECLLRLELLEEAAAAVEACLALDPGMENAIEERYNLLYLRGDYVGLRDALTADRERLDRSPRLANLLGHARYNLGAWDEAAEAYAAAAAGDPGMPIYSRNRAAALEKTGDLVAASASWLTAARGFYDQGAWDDAEDCSRRLRELGYDAASLDSLDGLIAYGRGDEKSAAAALGKLWKRGKADAPASYVYGLIMAGSGKRSDAIKAFRRAAELEPGRAIYRYRLAESLFMAGEACEPELAAAIEAAPDDGWTLNLAGQAALRAGDSDRAIALFSRAKEALPDESAPAVNLSEAYTAVGRHEEAVSALGDWPASSAQAANRLGNAYAARGRLDEAAAAYAEAVAKASAAPRAATGTGPIVDLDLPEYRVNLAAALIELGRLPDAEDALRRSLEERDDARAMYLMGDIAAEYGDSSRAELAYRAAVERDGGDIAARKRLAAHYLSRRRYDKAEAEARAVEAIDPAAAAELIAALREATVETLRCASCGRAWEAPKPVPAAPRSRLRGEPPDDSPAGSCPSCGKVFCVACRKDGLEDGRFTCPDCGERLNLNDDRVRWIVLDRLKRSADE
ncbi:MAG TPA: tetratricopeptide repeat protein [Spirochaetia bacterium]|nr:tetratricopeptide repeat protein [Spirochaetales bacterium]HRW23977.1 tetratricopeptide repeat protein [Spirochaetia bacterium]